MVDVTKMDIANRNAVETPLPGDYWHERFSPYLYVVDVDGDKITILNFLRFNTDLPYAYIDCGTCWRMDFTKATTITKQHLKKVVKYEGRDGFIADVCHKPAYLQEYLAEVYSPKS